MSKFKIGDKVVRVAECYDNYPIEKGGTYTIVDMICDKIYLEGIYDSYGKLDWFNPDNFELVQDGELDLTHIPKQKQQSIIKEYLTKNSEGKYQLVNHKFTENDIEVPDGAEHYVWFNDSEDGSEFYKDSFTKFYFKYDGVWDDVTFSKLPNKCKILWERSATNVENKNDLINAPKHYNTDPSGIECIELTRCLSFEAGNALKYIWRTGKKDDELQELKKAQWYVNDLIEHDVPIAIEWFGDTIEFETKVKKVLSTWSGWKYVFLNALYWNDKYEMRRAIDALVKEAENRSK